MPNVADLTVVSIPFLTVLCTLMLLCWHCLALQLRRHRRIAPRRRIALVGTAAVLTVLTAADEVNAYYSYLPNVSDVVNAVTMTPPPRLTAAAARSGQLHPDGLVLSLPIADRGSGFGPSTAWLWLPPQYFRQPADRFPVLYLFHGSPGMPRDWFRAGRAPQIALAAARGHLPAVVVAPQMSHSWTDDSECVNSTKERVETHLLLDVIPTVDATVRSIATRSGRIFAGMSAGGYCALNLGLRHLNQVETIIDLSGFTEPTHAGGPRALFGPDPAPAVEANSPRLYAADLTPPRPSRVWLDTGTEDRPVLAQINAIRPVLQRRGFEVAEHTRPGAHTYAVWRAGLNAALVWALAALQQQPADR